VIRATGLPSRSSQLCDPFDWILVAQARCEGLTLVTRDADVQQYDVSFLPA
jgi:PIN domain nuclease of toxin-antitoxin system